MVPTEKECFRLIEEHKMLPNIIDHSIQVKNVSLAITDNLLDTVSMDRDLITASALLHDIAKTRTIETREMRHDTIGADMMRELGYESIAKVIESHVIIDGYDHDGPLEPREIVFYADKRVMHDVIVSIEERVEDLVERYGITETVKIMISENKKFIYKVEEKIQSNMKDDINEVIESLKTEKAV